jgi:NADH:ubiquinone oxidoreductase subunit 6 (subunit J)
MPPKLQVKKKEEGKKVVKAVVVVLLLLLAAAFVEAQDQGGNQGRMPTAEEALSGFKEIGKRVVLGVRLAIAIAFWVAIAIMIAHFVIGKLAPARFQRLGAFWDGLERAKDIVYGYAWLFLLIFAIYAAIGVITNGGQMNLDTFSTVLRWLMVEPITDLFNEISGDQGTGQRPGG